MTDLTRLYKYCNRFEQKNDWNFMFLRTGLRTASKVLHLMHFITSFSPSFIFNCINNARCKSKFHCQQNDRFSLISKTISLGGY